MIHVTTLDHHVTNLDQNAHTARTLMAATTKFKQLWDDSILLEVF